ncbi:hypothetical protein ACWNFE_004691, partial [Escherichia coli]
ASTKATFSELPQQSPRNTLNPIKILAENSGDISPLKGDFYAITATKTGHTERYTMPCYQCVSGINVVCRDDYSQACARNTLNSQSIPCNRPTP